MRTLAATETRTRTRTDVRPVIVHDDRTVTVPAPRAAPQPAAAPVVADAASVPAAPMRFLGALLRRVARVAAPVVGRAVRTVTRRTARAVDEDRSRAYAEAGRAVPTLIGAVLTGRRR